MNPGSTRKNRFVRRLRTDNSQQVRRVVQGLFLVLNGWLGLQFFLWVLWLERGGQGTAFVHPTGVEGWLPIAGMMNTKYLLLTGHVPVIHPAAMVLFLAFVAMSLLLKKSFCSWLCPVGTFSEYLWKLGKKIYGRTLRLPKGLDVALRGLKYLLLGFFLFIVGSMSADALQEFMGTPYGLIADVKMLNFFRTMGVTGMGVVLVLVVLSTLVQNFWCRYLCPYGALMGLVSLFSPVKIRRDAEACIDCGKCAKACPSALKVDQLVQIRSVECTGCMACIAACSTQDALQFALPPRKAAASADRWYHRAVQPLAVAGILAVLFFAPILYARATGHWRTSLAPALYRELVPQANSLSHPGR
jgi:polyferredoxin